MTANGTQAPNDVGGSAASIDFISSLYDSDPTAAPKLTKQGQGDVTLSAANSYGGVTEIQQGVVIVRNPQAFLYGDQARNPGTFANTALLAPRLRFTAGSA